MFQSPKIQIIASMPEGDAILLIWVRLLCLAGQVNDGGKIYLAEDVPYTDEMLSTVFGKPVTIIRLAIETFRKFRMVEFLEDGTLSLCNWEKYQSEDKLAEIREQTRERVRKCRERKQLAESVDCNATGNVTSNATVTLRNAIDKDIEKDKDINKDIENKIIDLLSSSKDIFISLKLENEYEETLKMMIRAGQITKKIPTQERLEDLMKEMIFDRQNVCNKQGYLIECFRNERELCKTMYTN